MARVENARQMGNVAIQAVPMLAAELKKVDATDVKINLITIATPTVNATGNLENPETHSILINKHIHIYNTVDGVQMGMANKVDRESYGRTYKSSVTQNILLPTAEVRDMYTETVVDPGNAREGIPSSTRKKVNNVGAHSIDYDHPEYIMKKINDGTIPKN